MASPFRSPWIVAMAIAVLAGVFSITFLFPLAHASPIREKRYVLITHAPDSDSWWNVIKTSISEAGEDYGVKVDYRNPTNGDLADMARLIEQAAARGYDGVIVTIADYQVLKGALRGVTRKNIPLVTINSGTPEQSEQLGAVVHVGQSEYGAGLAAGERARAEGIHSFLCVNHYATNPASYERCRGFADGIGADVNKSTVDTNGVDPVSIESKVAAYMRQHPGTQAVLALGPDGAMPALKALRAAGLEGKVWFATFDLSDDIVRAIRRGAVRFAIDQQPFLQGYLPVAVLATLQKLHTRDLAAIESAIESNPASARRFAEYGLKPSYGAHHIDTGPSFVTVDKLPKDASMQPRSDRPLDRAPLALVRPSHEAPSSINATLR